MKHFLAATRRRRMALIPFGAVAIVVVVTSAAWACGVFVGDISARGNINSGTIATAQGAGSGHFGISNNIARAQSCFAMTQLTGPCAVTLGTNSWVDIHTQPNGNTPSALPDSSLTYQTAGPGLARPYCQAGPQPPTNPDTGGVGGLPPGCFIGDTTDGLGLDAPPVAVTDDIGEYWVNLNMFSWMDGNFNGTYDSTNERVTGYTGCTGFNGDQTHRVVHLGLATISGGKITSARRAIRIDRAAADQYPISPQPASLGSTAVGSDTWRFYFPATLPTAPTENPAIAPVNSLLASSVCVLDRYGSYAAEVPLQLMVL